MPHPPPPRSPPAVTEEEKKKVKAKLWQSASDVALLWRRNSIWNLVWGKSGALVGEMDLRCGMPQFLRKEREGRCCLIVRWLVPSPPLLSFYCGAFASLTRKGGFCQIKQNSSFFRTCFDGWRSRTAKEDTEVPKLGETHSLDESPSMSFLSGGVFLSAITRKKGKRREAAIKKEGGKFFNAEH